ncbi:putative thioesterase superfamily protein [Rosellinia necatrix]|uniref:Putative thioesterase superfamily protein n=1 Tax=Rosellinia necatrix TaxID=77044 RepID=A0A1W2TTS3_ROSNE|nr:putative thioesterase superfamily protein [Rosellinia necatrix]
MVRVTAHSILAWEPESEADLRFFQNIPWCAEIINLPGVKAYRGDFALRQERGMDPVIHGFMFRERGVMKYGSFLAEPGTLRPNDSDQVVGLDPVTSSTSLELSSAVNTAKNEYPIHLDVFTLGQGLQGFPQTIYGGVLALLADGICGRVAFMHRDPTNQIYTAYTNTRFIKPMIADQDGTITILVKTHVSQLRSTKGKIIVTASFEGAGGLVYATAESMVVEKIWKGRL